jgi:two-component system, cell cycle sensor histidine kinase and response regulator CckA
MGAEAKILFVEDSPFDFTLEERQLRSAGIRFISKRVETREDLLRELEEFKPDLLISDYMLPTLDGPTILQIVRERRPALPFIFVSGTIGEERAVESVKNGATDYLIKDRLNSLGLKVQRALKEVEEREARRLLGEQLRQSQKMEAIGRLAGGVAHDFNNLLTVINGYSELLLNAIPQDHPNRPDLDEIHKAGLRGAALTRQLLIFSRKQVTQAVSLDLNEVVEAIEKMLGRLVGRDIKISTARTPQPCKVTADPAQIEQVIVNLVVNARDAMPNGGRITIETAMVVLDEDYVRKHPGSRQGPHAKLCVRDAGVGIPPNILEHIFEPFFTTKDAGRGTGLGLSLVHGIVTQAGGTIEVESVPGGGSTFTILIPAAVKGETRVRPPVPAVKHDARGTETILIAEDQESVRKLAAAVLEAGGYKVLKATDGTDALSRCASYDGPIHLLVTDLVMQTMTGVELAALVRRHHPETRFLLMSGYAYRNPQLQDLIQGGLPFLEKPFTPEDLKRKVREVLEAP